MKFDYYSGLNMMGESQQKGVGFRGTPTEWRSLSAEAQYPYVRRFFEMNMADPKMGKGDYNILKDPGRLYLMNITPAYLSKPDEYVVFEPGSSGYKNNLVIANASAAIRGGPLKPLIDISDMKYFVEWSKRQSSVLWNELRWRLQKAMGGVPIA